ncbi:PREDICTED: inactive rhomboid protein 2-like [Amphimedon queenslandica]|uniref:Peptidase S54 rhomboid domain-containing protein n=1 Tax=Amphimedon queenslandica TaxID=400682 RepID=A0A1X7VFI0_AMPQE|nr:PREDICTED: inactive rhomboid protein 2-like [Amphimedon queenslandica]|eukprot:XP_003384540.1 PREDICTED: inactive rhomboid protein 2-like [Amphimedon queenslandica]
MATSALPTLESIPEDRPVPPASPTPPQPKNENKWDTIRRVVKSQALQFVGLEHPQSTQEHQEHVQRSIVVAKMEQRVKRLKSTEAQLDCDKSLVEAIVPHETVAPVTTHSLLRQLSVKPDQHQTAAEGPALPTPPPPPSAGGHESIPMRAIDPSYRYQTSEPVPDSSTATGSSRIERSLSAPTRSTMGVSLATGASSTLQRRAYLSRPTGRLEAEPEELQIIEPKPDLWKIAKIALMSLSYLSTQKKEPEEGEPSQATAAERQWTHQESFLNVEEVDSGEMSDIDGGGIALKKIQYEKEDSTKSPDFVLFEDDNLFGREMTDGQIARRKFEVPDEPPPQYDTLDHIPKEVKPRRKKLLRQSERKAKHYRGPLRGVTLRLLNFNYKNVKSDTRQRLAEMEQPSLHRPFFAYWLMTVHILILVFSLSVYGFAPYGFDLKTERALVQQSNLAVAVEEKNISTNVWGGPPQSALVLLGATYGPCMRYDRQLARGLDIDRWREANSSGCCVRLDNSGCVQVTSREQCPELFSDFVYIDQELNDSTVFTDRAVCGTSPLSCLNPNPSHDTRWMSENITEWPICQESQTRPSEHLSCNLTGRPCCVGIQAHCLITTLEHCDFLDGRFHADAFLCSQVDCLSDLCGLLPFVYPKVPDQFYRLLTSLFLHAGIIHLVFTLTFHFFVLRHVEKYLGWLRTSLIYLGSGLGGNIVSAVFVPYNPEVGPAGGIFGIISFFLIYIMYQAHRLTKPWKEALKLLIIIIILLCCGLFPFIDNFAHFGGFLFGTLWSGILVPYYQPLDAELAYYRDKHKREYNPWKDWIQVSKILFIFIGTPVLILLYLLFFLIFYVEQDTWDGFRFLNCIPFTRTFCLNFGQNIRSRDIFI